MSAPGITIARAANGSRLRALLSSDAGLRITAGIAIVLFWEIAVLLWAPAYVARPSGIVMAVPRVVSNAAFWKPPASRSPAWCRAW